MKLLLDYGLIEIIVLIIGILFIISTIFYVFPIIKIYLNYKSTLKEKNKKRDLIRKIALQKDLEDKIAKEINI
ncbi:MAG: hypothetical protein PHI37_03345 [Candidatus Gracilibacteria bacterium]|nr:hypothetical protein [Candidatus Gracilibacteria bacterium]